MEKRSNEKTITATSIISVIIILAILGVFIYLYMTIDKLVLIEIIVGLIISAIGLRWITRGRLL